ncbi:reverse transcriptase domain-containing protein [Tanacetum coccineum]
MTNLTDMLSKFVNSNTASTSGSGTLPSNTITNPKVDLKVVERETEVTKDMVPPTNNGSTKDVQPSVVQVQSQVPNSKPVVDPVSAPMPNLKTSIPYPSRRNDEKRREKANDQIEKFYKIFQDMSFEISLADALILMPKFASTLKALIGNKEKLSEMARTPLNEHCSAVILNKLPEKLGDPGKFLIPCDFPGMEECLALADLGTSINLMPLSVWKKPSLPELTPTCMTLELADRSITKPIGIADDVYLKVGKFKFLVDFVVVDFDADPRVPLILGRSFLKTGRTLIDVYEGAYKFKQPGTVSHQKCFSEYQGIQHDQRLKMLDVKTANTPMETHKALLKDADGEDVDEHMYRSMIGSLMYLTSSRPDIMFVDSPFDLVAYTDSDYAGASLDRKSTTGGCKFLGCRLISWQCKKQTVVANSITKAEYVAASSCCGQVLWIQYQLLDYGYNFMHTKIYIDNESTICIVKNPVFHSKIKHIEIRHHFIRDSNEKKLIQMIKIHTDKNVADLLPKAFDVSRFQYLIDSIGMLNL